MPSTAHATRSAQQIMTPPPNQDTVKENIAPTSPPNVSQPEVRSDSLKKRHRMSSAQLICLESLFQKDTHPSKERKSQLADELGM